MEIYKIVEKYVTLSSITKSLLRLDTSLDKEDIIQEVYLKVYQKDTKYIYNYIKQEMLMLYRKLKIRKFDTCICEDNLLEDDTNVDIQSKVLSKMLLEKLKNKDSLAYNCVVSYFFKRMTYKEIAKEENISFRYVKYKIDKALEYMKNLR